MPETSRGWLPIRTGLHRTGIYFALRQIGPEELRDPFLNETIARVPAPEKIVQVMDTDPAPSKAAAPAGIVFHVGRSGSTLVSQLLKGIDGVVVYAEPQTVNEILVPPHKWERTMMIRALRALGHAFAQHARGRYVLKLTSWNTLYCDVLAEAFPETPWVFIARDPLETGVSNLRSLPGWFRNTEETSRQLAKVVDPTRTARSAEDYVSLAYGALCEAVDRLDPARGKLVPYAALPSAAWEQVAPHFSLVVDEEARGRLAGIARSYSKAPPGEAAEFASDAGEKQEAASDALRAAVDKYARPPLNRLMAAYPGFRL